MVTEGDSQTYSAEHTPLPSLPRWMSFQVARLPVRHLPPPPLNTWARLAASASSCSESPPSRQAVVRCRARRSGRAAGRPWL